MDSSQLDKFFLPKPICEYFHGLGLTPGFYLYSWGKNLGSSVEALSEDSIFLSRGTPAFTCYDILKFFPNKIGGRKREITINSSHYFDVHYKSIFQPLWEIETKKFGKWSLFDLYSKRAQELVENQENLNQLDWMGKEECFLGFLKSQQIKQKYSRLIKADSDEIDVYSKWYIELSAKFISLFETGFLSKKNAENLRDISYGDKQSSKLYENHLFDGSKGRLFDIIKSEFPNNLSVFFRSNEDFIYSLSNQIFGLVNTESVGNFDKDIFLISLRMHLDYYFNTQVKIEPISHHNFGRYLSKLFLDDKVLYL